MTLSKGDRDSLGAALDLGDKETLYTEVERIVDRVSTEAKNDGYRSGRNYSDEFSSAMVLVFFGLLAAFIIGLTIRMQINNVNQGKRELHACASGWTVECQQAVQEEGDDSARCTLYRTAYHEATGRSLPPLENK